MAPEQRRPVALGSLFPPLWRVVVVVVVLRPAVRVLQLFDPFADLAAFELAFSFPHAGLDVPWALPISYQLFQVGHVDRSRRFLPPFRRKQFALRVSFSESWVEVSRLLDVESAELGASSVRACR